MIVHLRKYSARPIYGANFVLQFLLGLLWEFLADRHMLSSITAMTLSSSLYNMHCLHLCGSTDKNTVQVMVQCQITPTDLVLKLCYCVEKLFSKMLLAHLNQQTLLMFSLFQCKESP